MIKINNLKKFLSCFFLLSWILLIFSFSHTPGPATDEQSKTIVNQIIGNTNKTTNTTVEQIENNVPIDSKDTVDIEYLNYIVRKIAHMSEYFILALLVLNVIYQFKGKVEFKHYIIVICFCCFYAITDEVHQLYIPGRTGQVKDVLIDTLGASMTCIFVMLIKKVPKIHF